MRIIAGAHGGRTLKTVEGPGYRPAMARVRESLFSMLESRGVVWHGLRVLDLFAGSGSLGFEALSRGAEEAWFIDNNPKAAECIRRNAATLGIAESRCTVLSEDISRIISRRARAAFDVIFIDPPYGQDRLLPTLRSVMRNGWLAEDGMLAAEVELALKLDAEKAHPDLEPVVDRTYGQTRIVVWMPRSDA